MDALLCSLGRSEGEDDSIADFSLLPAAVAGYGHSHERCDSIVKRYPHILEHSTKIGFAESKHMSTSSHSVSLLFQDNEYSRST